VINRSFVSQEFRQRVRGLGLPVALAFGRLGLTPNMLTIVGFLGTCLAAVAAATGQWTTAGVLVIGFGIFDMFDGALARATGTASRFGAFLDSTLDRTGEGLVLAGVGFGCAATGFAPGALLAGTALAFASVVTYTRAKAEALGLHGEVGYAPRPERLVILAVGLALAGITGGVGVAECGNLFCLDGAWEPGNVPLALALGLITVLSAVTVVQRILHVKEQLDQIDR
jgi:CDP-diacylglycerol--glycerol-3-phosphate 3-phosphatidyltransferase